MRFVIGVKNKGFWLVHWYAIKEMKIRNSMGAQSSGIVSRTSCTLSLVILFKQQQYFC